MLLNANIALSSSAALLVPYSSWHVPRYHEWMKDPDIQEATASEPLTIEEEYSMQRSWRQDADKLTFIVCRAITTGDEGDIPSQRKLQAESDSPSNMVGDINLFLRIDDGDEGDSPPQIVGEVELMIAEKVNQRRGFGRAALLMFMRYIVERQGSILEEFVAGGSVDVETVRKLRSGVDADLEFECLSVKIGSGNGKSLALFESTGFEKCAEEPNFFGEFELRRRDLSLGGVDGALERAGVKGFMALPYERTE
ncbi:unnamed protein product [Penicillium salamii]|uniref:N-acetyltransferase domain-containing protein n=1 Tax=Penicillium salamii TaxID=1612424 RepID=A0A9W4NKT2_9EURO|nr:unnamed protein product [Penicillium salamii]CAG8190806.1 unnamed protein product [Penicillium salamii]CAG8285792.1 unnamed protein product [Penicillium salamii]CAG8297659.1 unnamed protein product [Penicillium salamii]CAG8374620.1 unnamed protein product [Penicillium salamii]